MWRISQTATAPVLPPSQSGSPVQKKGDKTRKLKFHLFCILQFLVSVESFWPYWDVCMFITCIFLSQLDEAVLDSLSDTNQPACNNNNNNACCFKISGFHSDCLQILTFLKIFSFFFSFWNSARLSQQLLGTGVTSSARWLCLLLSRQIEKWKWSDYCFLHHIFDKGTGANSKI